MKLFLKMAAIALGSAGAASAQTETKIVVDTTLVVIPVTVTDPSNRFVLGLEKEDFTVFEDDRAAEDHAFFR